MKKAHRTSHFLIWALLGPALILVLCLAVQQRPTAPVNPDLPDVLIEGAG